MRIRLLGIGALALACCAEPLRVLPSNPRWFTDGSGKAVLLVGSHSWANLQDNGLLTRGAVSNPPAVFDYDGYLRWLVQNNHNFFRLWRWETTRWTDDYTGKEVKYCRPHPWLRTGPGVANDGEPKFDLTKFNPEYFARLQERVAAAGKLGIYASVMLFEGWEIQFSDAWQNHPFNAANNVNGVEGGNLAFNTMQAGDMGRRVLDLQQAYVRQVIDTVNGLDNVLYEICNEAAPTSTDWQYHLIRYVKEYESRKAKQHPVGMTFQYKGGSNSILYDSPADWISPNPGDAKQSYLESPCPDCTTKVVVNDTDHLWGHTGGDSIWVWRSFTRGLNVLFMEELLPSPTWQDSARTAMGQVRRYANRMDLAAMRPEEKLSGTRYCLAQRGKEYLVFQSNKGEFTLDLTDAPGTFEVEWLNINTDRTLAGKSVEGGGIRTFTTPFPGPAALYLKRAAPMSGEMLQPAQLKEDLRILRAALDEGHPGIYRYSTKAEVDRAFAQAEAQLNRPMSAMEFYRIAAPAVGALKCGHTSLTIPADLQRSMRETVRLIPLDVRVLEGKIFVFRDYSETPRLAGAEILSINGTPATQILRTMLATIHGDGDTPTAGPWRIGAGHAFARALYTLAGIESPFQVEYQLGGKRATVKLDGITAQKAQEIADSLYPQDKRPASAATYRFLDKTRTGVLKINQFGGKAEDGKPLGQFIQQAYDELQKQQATSLIIDVRDNGGGADELGKQLFSYLVTQPFPYYSDLVINKLQFDFFQYVAKPEAIPEKEVEKRPNGKYLLNSHPNWGTQQPGKPHFAGQVLVLMNGGSFSTTCEFLSTLHNHHRATFIGQEAAGGYYGNTSGPGATVTAPNSKVRLPVRFMTYYMAIPGTAYGNRSIPADRPVSYTIDELLAGKDKEMEVALQLAGGAR